MYLYTTVQPGWTGGGVRKVYAYIPMRTQHMYTRVYAHIRIHTYRHIHTHIMWCISDTCMTITIILCQVVVSDIKQRRTALASAASAEFWNRMAYGNSLIYIYIYTYIIWMAHWRCLYESSAIHIIVNHIGVSVRFFNRGPHRETPPPEIRCNKLIHLNCRQ